MLWGTGTATTLRRIVLGLLVAGSLLFAWTMCVPHTRQIDAPVSLAQAEGCPIPLPPTARNIRYRLRRQWIELDETVRFEAPVDVCIAHADTVIKACQARFGSEYPVEQKTLAKMHPPEGAMNSYRSSSPAWFDVWNIVNGLEAGGGGTLRPKIWIDTDRGVFYYQLTD